ncbi:MAG: ATP-binding protein [Chromatiales bacterium]|jgi:hypothetical protein
MENFRSDILIHIGETLDDDRIHELEKQLSFENGVYSACVNEKARHLMLVDYDPASVHAVDILHQVQDSGLHAELIGL